MKTLISTIAETEFANIIITAFITGIFTYWLTSKRDRKTIIYEANKELLVKVYSPIMKIINNSVYPGDGYEGLDDDEIQEIADIIHDNLMIIDRILDSFAWSFKEEIHNSGYKHYSQYSNYDDDRKFLDYISYRYNYLRKSVGLQYDNEYFFYKRVIKSIKKRTYRVDRWFRKTKNKIIKSKFISSVTTWFK
jgi:hypothetical protein